MVQANKQKNCSIFGATRYKLCSPGRKDTAYCEKPDSIKVYRSKHYLLFTYRELVYLYNKENDSNITYHQLREVINAENYLINRKVQEEATGEEAAMLLSEMVDGSKMRMYIYNISRQFLELKWLKAYLKEDEVILSVYFSKNYENKLLREIQSAYFGHKNFTIFTAACYFHESIAVENGKLNEESDLVKLPAAIISNETSHDRNVALANSNRLISMVKDIAPSGSTFHFWNEGVLVSSGPNNSFGLFHIILKKLN